MSVAPAITDDESRLLRVVARVKAHEPLDQDDAEWLIAALLWETSCLNCGQTMEALTESEERREQVEAELTTAGLANGRTLAHMSTLAAELTSVKAELEAARSAKPWFETDFNVRRAGNRLTAYVDSALDVPDVGDSVIVGVSEYDGGIACLATVHSTREVPPRGFRTEPMWAIELDWAGSHA